MYVCVCGGWGGWVCGCVWGRVDVCGYVWVCVGMWGECVDMCREVGVCVSAYVGGSVEEGRSDTRNDDQDATVCGG